MTTNLYILTGAPGTGKTAILDALGDGVHTFAEPARAVIAEQRALDGDGTWDRDPARFVELLLERSIENYAKAAAQSDPVVFDRGIPDCTAYALAGGTDPKPSAKAAQRYRYHPQVLVTRPWEEIYTTDEERKATFDQVVAFDEHVDIAYERAGYTLLVVPQGTIVERTAFVTEFIAAGELR